MKLLATVLHSDYISIYEWDGSLHRIQYFEIEEQGTFKRSYILKYSDGTTQNVASSYFNSLEICPERLVQAWNGNKPLIPHNS